ncbi:hypothetical protein H9L13_08260 [Sphingomonas lutea]|uniref:WGxxGxxG-CTERM domain-containing protein n=1 Tax=Sphingomonas lutea TaxID=1045317 RepID=A0A7G9SFQ8_9SPHN|nr:hypothetical protein [Sphingomonas lutea]QNN66683.1 hypothetical protein H9L13_08260 [Sphingomonas lutea]
MRRKLTVALLAAAAFAITPAVAQVTTDVPPETVTRTGSDDGQFWYNLIGLIGLLGLRGLWRDSDNDGYTDDPV